jgi:hypothetical protein
MGEGKSRIGLTTLLAIIGTTVGVLTLYFTQSQKHIENRPVLEVTNAVIVSRNTSSYSETDEAEFTVVNYGNRIASEVTMETAHPLFLKFPKGDFTINPRVTINDIPPNQPLKQNVVSFFELDQKRASLWNPWKFAPHSTIAIDWNQSTCMRKHSASWLRSRSAGRRMAKITLGTANSTRSFLCSRAGVVPKTSEVRFRRLRTTLAVHRGYSDCASRHKPA